MLCRAQNVSANGLAGSPVTAVQGSASVSVTFTVIGGNGTTASNVSLFGINYCSGQVTVLVSNSLNARTTPQYRLLVQACSNGNAASCAVANVTVMVLAVPHPPTFNDTYGVRYVDEFSAIGTLIPPNITAYDQDGDAFRFSIVPTASFNYLVNITTYGCFYVTGIIDYDLVRPVRGLRKDRCACVVLCIGGGECLFVCHLGLFCSLWCCAV